ERVLVESLTAQHEALALEASTIEEQFLAADSHRSEQETIASDRKKQAEETERSAEAARQRLYQAGSDLEKAKSSANFAQLRLQELQETVARIETESTEREEFLASAT